MVKRITKKIYRLKKYRLPTAACGDTLDWKNIEADEIIRRVTSKVQSGSIIQFHSGTQHTAEALPEILDYLKQENLNPVCVGELIYKNSYTIDNSGLQKAENPTS